MAADAARAGASSGWPTARATPGSCSRSPCSACSRSGFTITILSVSIPRIADELGSDTSTVTWVVTGPLLAFAVVGPAMGKLGDLLRPPARLRAVDGLRVPCSPALTAVAWSAGSLIAFRTLGAATGAAVGPGVDRHHQPAVPARAAGAGDGLLVDGRRRRAGHRRGRRRPDRRDVRLAVDLRRPGAAHAGRPAARDARAPRDRAARAGPRSTAPGAVVLAVGATSLLFAINRGPLWGWSHPAIVAGFVVAPVAARRLRRHRAAGRAPAAAAAPTCGGATSPSPSPPSSSPTSPTWAGS